ncbi:MAG: glycosyltransferase [Leptolyngbyaceae cyanobacterium bins.302]|nr:glycosyltransferase [Leptolyngbyaceae cyanobacterium bins.302]
MRFVFLVPDLYPKSFVSKINTVLKITRLKPLSDFVRLRVMPVDQVFGGTLNIMRHCAVARSCGVEAVLATIRGKDTYAKNGGLYDLPIIRWADRKPEDICIVPDLWTELIDEVKGPAIAYQQVPIHTRNNFNYNSDRVSIWTDSPYMEAICAAAYPNKAVEIVPNIIDNKLFPFIPQAQREAGLLFAFPRKGREFIAATQAHYQALGGNYWKFELVDGLTIQELAKQFQRPQAFLASADMEGCALPPQESMASGIIVVGKTAKGANFCMEHRQTAMAAETPEAAAHHLIELEDAALRESLSCNAYQYISQYFPDRGPKQFWQQIIAQYARSQSTTTTEKCIQEALLN